MKLILQQKNTQFFNIRNIENLKYFSKLFFYSWNTNKIFFADFLITHFIIKIFKNKRRLTVIKIISWKTYNRTCCFTCNRFIICNILWNKARKLCFKNAINPKIKGKTRWRILIKANKRVNIQKILKEKNKQKKKNSRRRLLMMSKNTAGHLVTW